MEYEYSGIAKVECIGGFFCFSIILEDKSKKLVGEITNFDRVKLFLHLHDAVDFRAFLLDVCACARVQRRNIETMRVCTLYAHNRRDELIIIGEKY